MSALDWVFGWRTLRFSLSDRTAVFDLAYRAGIRLGRERFRGGEVLLRAGAGDALLLSRLAEERGISVRLSEIRGLPAAFRFCLRRPGIAVGLLAGAVFLAWSSGVVWDIRIEGNTETSDEAILDQLEELGFGIGTRFRDVDFDQLHADYAAAQNDLSWLSVCMDGTVARVQVTEMREKEPARDHRGLGANVVAAEDGVIEEIRPEEGQAAKRTGEVIRKGEVAISGILEKKDGGFRYEYAGGEVLATVPVPIRVEVPFEQVEMRPTGRENCRKTLKIFGKRIKFLKNYGIAYRSCDTIDIIGRVCLFDRIPLPVWIGETVTRETEARTVILTPEEAEEEAKARMRLLIREKAAEGELSSKSIRGFDTGTAYRLDALLYVTKDIGKTEEFGLSDPP